jgi:hypothetical protein
MAEITQKSTITDIKNWLKNHSIRFNEREKKQYYIDLMIQNKTQEIHILEHPSKKTISELISWLIDAKIEIPPNRQKKDFYVQMVLEYNRSSVTKPELEEVTKPESKEFIKPELEEFIKSESKEVKKPKLTKEKKPQIMMIRKNVNKTCYLGKETTNETKRHTLKLVYACVKCLNPEECHYDSRIGKLKKLITQTIIDTSSYCKLLTPIMKEFEFELWSHNEQILKKHGITYNSLKKLDDMTNEEDMYKYLQQIYKKKTKNITATKPKNFIKLLVTFILGAFIVGVGSSIYNQNNATIDDNQSNNTHTSQYNTRSHNTQQPHIEVKNEGYGPRHSSFELERNKGGYVYTNEFEQNTTPWNERLPETHIMTLNEYKEAHKHMYRYTYSTGSTNEIAKRNNVLQWKDYVLYLTQNYFPIYGHKIYDNSMDIDEDVIYNMYKMLKTKLDSGENTIEEEEIFEELNNNMPTKEELKKYCDKEYTFSQAFSQTEESKQYQRKQREKWLHTF